MAINQSPADLPRGCEVLVVGAGPAGSAAARCLAQAGLDVVLVDQHLFPRDKVCGDALIPDAHRALERLGLLDAVLALAEPVAHVADTGPRAGRLAVLPRRELDEQLCLGAVRAGARIFAPVRFVSVLEQPGPAGTQVVGALLQSGQGQHPITARWVLQATGAQPQALQAADMLLRRTPSSMSMRGYLRKTTLHRPQSDLDMVWHARLRSGYGWVFPGPGGVFNVGVYLTDSHTAGRDGRHRMQDVNLRDTFQTSLRRALEAILGGANDAAVRAHYEQGLLALAPHFDAYRRGNLAKRRPWLVDLPVWSARRSLRRQRKLAAVLDERHTPRSLMRAGTWWRLLTAQS
jgi:flavin-dependent dehydrogenase